jgi:hypothetical protein
MRKSMCDMWRLIGAIGLWCAVISLAGLTLVGPAQVREWWRATGADSEQPGITRRNFDRIELGMTYEEVASILGSAGAEMSRVSFHGPATIERSWLSIRSFSCAVAPCVARVVVSFVYGRVVGKSQTGVTDTGADDRAVAPL